MFNEQWVNIIIVVQAAALSLASFYFMKRYLAKHRHKMTIIGGLYCFLLSLFSMVFAGVTFFLIVESIKSII
jgi:uncharacterized membrane protein